MKQLFFYFVLAITIIVASSCNNNGSDSKESESTNTETNDEQIVISPEEKARITPSDIDINTPVPVTQLYNSFFEWKDKEVVIAGYVKMYLDTDKLKESIEIIGSPDSYDVLFSCNFAEAPGQTINKDDIVIIKGKIQEKSYWGIKMVDCEFVGVNEEISDETNPNPYRLPKKPVLAENLYKVYTWWEDVEITVIGYYNSTTTSILSDNTIWRIDLADPETGDKKVGCNMKTEPDNDYLKDNRNDVKIRGIIKGESFGRVSMEECEMLD